MEFSNASAISFANDLAQSQSHGSRMSTGVVVTTAIAIVLGMSFMVALKMGELDASEPILLKPTFPFIGHLLGMLRWQVGYMQMLRYVEFWATGGDLDLTVILLVLKYRLILPLHCGYFPPVSMSYATPP